MKTLYEISSSILSLVSKISEKIGEVRAAYLYSPPTELRKKNRIKTIQSSSEIEEIENSLCMMLFKDRSEQLISIKHFVKEKNIKALINFALFKS